MTCHSGHGRLKQVRRCPRTTEQGGAQHGSESSVPALEWGGWAPGGDIGVVLVCGVDVPADGAKTLAPSGGTGRCWSWTHQVTSMPGSPSPALAAEVSLGRGQNSWGGPGQGQGGFWGEESPTVELGTLHPHPRPLSWSTVWTDPRVGTLDPVLASEVPRFVAPRGLCSQGAGETQVLR